MMTDKAMMVRGFPGSQRGFPPPVRMTMLNKKLAYTRDPTVPHAFFGQTKGVWWPGEITQECSLARDRQRNLTGHPGGEMDSLDGCLPVIMY